MKYKNEMRDFIKSKTIDLSVFEVVDITTDETGENLATNYLVTCRVGYVDPTTMFYTQTNKECLVGINEFQRYLEEQSCVTWL